MAERSNRKDRRRQKKLARQARRGGPSAGPGPVIAEALAFHRSGRLAEAVDAYRRALAEAPAQPHVLANLAGALAGLGKHADAIQCLRQALDIDPEFATAHYDIGVLLQGQGKLDEAARAYEEALALNARSFESLVNLGVVRQAQGRLAEAEDAYRRAIAVDPRVAELHSNLGVVLERRGDAAGAVGCFRQALVCKPDYVLALNGLGVALQKQGDAAAAAAAFERALKIKPDFVEALNNLGNLCHKLGRLDEAARHMQRAIAIQPDYAEAHRNYAHVLLLQGNFKAGWPEFQWRWRCRDFPSERRTFAAPAWSGQPLKGKTILVWGEQGVGDEIHFAHMMPDLIARDARVVLECERRLVPLFKRSFAGVTCVARATPPAPETASGIDFQAPIGNLGRWLRPDLESFPERPSYLVADAGRRDALRDKYRAGSGDLLVGIAWISKNPEVGPEKSMALAEWRPLAAIAGVRFVDLQYGDTEAERRAFEDETGARIIHDASVDQMADMDAFAAQVAAMDLVVSVSNTTVHVAGALGVPTWVLLGRLPLAVWMAEGKKSPWYPSLRLYRQAKAGEWGDAIGRIEKDLGELAAGR
jgi:tetratricopeptide (TPR) repeat protein